jgi:predicted nucleotide-binding protein
MSREHNDSDKRFIDTISSVSLKKNGTPSTQDILDVISYLEKEKKLDSYQAMLRYLSTTSAKSLDDPLKEIGLTSRKAVKEVIKGIEGLERINTDFSRLSENLAPFTLHSEYLSSLNKLIKPLAGSSLIGKELENAVKQMQPGLIVSIKEMQQALEQASVPLVGMQEAIKQASVPLVGMQEAIKQASVPLVGMQEAIKQASVQLVGMQEAAEVMRPGLMVTKETQDAFKQIQRQWLSLQPLTNTWKQAIQQLQPSNFETFLPESQEVVSRKLTVATDVPVSQLVKTLETTENELAETTRTVSNLWKPEPATVGRREQAFLEDLYELAAQKTGKPDTEATFQMFKPSNSEKQRIAKHLSMEGLAKLKRDNSINITQKGARFLEKISSEEPYTQPVFLVHGRDYSMKNAVSNALEKMNLKPVKLDKVNSEGRTIIEKLLDTTDDIPGAIILLSPDDRGAFKNETARPRARQNVIFEHGFFVGKFGRAKRGHVIIICKGDKTMEIPSDIKGVELIRYTKNGKWREKLASELRGCDYKVPHYLAN